MSTAKMHQSWISFGELFLLKPNLQKKSQGFFGILFGGQFVNVKCLPAAVYLQVFPSPDKGWLHVHV